MTSPTPRPRGGTGCGVATSSGDLLGEGTPGDTSGDMPVASGEGSTVGSGAGLVEGAAVAASAADGTGCSTGEADGLGSAASRMPAPGALSEDEDHSEKRSGKTGANAPRQSCHGTPYGARTTGAVNARGSGQSGHGNRFLSTKPLPTADLHLTNREVAEPQKLLAGRPRLRSLATRLVYVRRLQRPASRAE
jgi:hypothetical protein